MRLTPLAATLLIVYAGACHAGLGGAPVQFPSENNALKPQALVSTASTVSAASTMSTNAGNYTQVDSTLASGTQVHQFVAQSGVVFAVSWNGPFLPDLKQLLGDHFATMVAESAKTPKAGHPHTSVNQPNIVIFSGGHMRAFEGRAWIPSALPAGFNTDAIQ